jgi:hypothetical protein
MTTKINLVLAITFITTINTVTWAKPANAIMTTVNNPTTLISDSTPVQNTNAITPAVLPKKLLTNFNRSFPEATNSKWTKTGTTFFVNFNMNGNTAMATFNTKGKLNYGLIYKKAVDLPSSIQQTINKNYASFTIISVTEIRIPGIVNYKVVLSDQQQYIDLRLTQDGQIQQSKQVKMPS